MAIHEFPIKIAPNIMNKDAIALLFPFSFIGKRTGTNHECILKHVNSSLLCHYFFYGLRSQFHQQYVQNISLREVVFRDN